VGAYERDSGGIGAVVVVSRSSLRRLPLDAPLPRLRCGKGSPVVLDSIVLRRATCRNGIDAFSPIPSRLFILLVNPQSCPTSYVFLLLTSTPLSVADDHLIITSLLRHLCHSPFFPDSTSHLHFPTFLPSRPVEQGVPTKLLHESLGHVITVELKTGQTYRGKLFDGAFSSLSFPCLRVERRSSSESTRGGKTAFDVEVQ
jgi:hypothetical protein